MALREYRVRVVFVFAAAIVYGQSVDTDDWWWPLIGWAVFAICFFIAFPRPTKKRR